MRGYKRFERKINIDTCGDLDIFNFNEMEEATEVSEKITYNE